MRLPSPRSALVVLSIAVTLGGCATKTDAEYQSEVVSSMHDQLAANMVKWKTAAVALQAAAPAPTGRGWDATLDADAIASMKTHWAEAREQYELIEGALAPIFPNVDTATDARYDDFAALYPDGDADLFDDQGVTGMHAMERILWAPQTPQRVIDFEQTLTGFYMPAAWPATETEAAEFKNKLAQRLVSDITAVQPEWDQAKANFDLGGAFQGLVSLMNEQQEKVNKAASGEEESRYSQTTLLDLHHNLTGTSIIYELFRPWVRTKKNGTTDDATIEAGFGKLKAAYDVNAGDAIPQPPPGWSSDAPSQADLATPFGVLYSTVHNAVNPDADGSVVHSMNSEATDLGFPQFVEGE